MNHNTNIEIREFSCQKCGRCCKTPGWVYVTATEISAIAAFLGLELAECRRRYTTRDNGWEVISTPDFRSDCFLDEQGNCTIYPVRPRYCQTYPHSFHSRREFRIALKTCPELQRLNNLTKEQDIHNATYTVE